MAEPRGKVLQGKTDKVVKKPPIKAKLPTEVKREDLDFENSFGVQIEDTMATFIPSAGLFGRGGDLRRLLREPMRLGILINCVDQVWYVEAEPTGPDTAGALIYAPQKGKKGWESRKPILSGQCKITSESGEKSLKFDLKTVYENVSASPRGDSVTVGGSVSDGPAGTTTTISVSYKIEF